MNPIVEEKQPEHAGNIFHGGRGHDKGEQLHATGEQGEELVLIEYMLHSN